MDDRTAIIEQLHRMATAIDDRDWQTIRAIFTEDATGYGGAGVDAVLARMYEHLGGCGPTQHLLGNHRVTVDGEHARSAAYARVYHQGAGPMRGEFFECMGAYDDRWVRTDVGWRLSYRHFDMRITLGNFAVLRPA